MPYIAAMLGSFNEANHARFPFETGNPFGIAHQMKSGDLDGDDAVQARIERFVNFPPPQKKLGGSQDPVRITLAVLRDGPI